MDYVYPEAKEVKAESSAIDKAVVAEAMIEIIERGALNYKGFPDGARLSKIHVCSLICASFDYGLQDVMDVYDEIEAEKKALEAVSPRDYTTQAKFVAAIEAVTNYIPDAVWFTKLKLKYGVTTWTALKALFPAEEV